MLQRAPNGATQTRRHSRPLNEKSRERTSDRSSNGGWCARSKTNPQSWHIDSAVEEKVRATCLKSLELAPYVESPTKDRKKFTDRTISIRRCELGDLFVCDFLLRLISATTRMMSMLTYSRRNRLRRFGIRHHLCMDMPMRRTAIQAGD